MSKLLQGINSTEASAALNRMVEKLYNPECNINVLKNAIDALELLMKNGVEEHLENEFSTVRIEDWIEELKAVYNYEPDNSPTFTQFERDGGFGLSDAERNK